jgi:hypothetical protein
VANVSQAGAQWSGAQTACSLQVDNLLEPALVVEMLLRTSGPLLPGGIYMQLVCHHQQQGISAERCNPKSSSRHAGQQQQQHSKALLQTHWPNSREGRPQQLAVHLQALRLSGCREEGFSFEKLPQDAAQRPTVDCGAVRV